MMIPSTDSLNESCHQSSQNDNEWNETFIDSHLDDEMQFCTSRLDSTSSLPSSFVPKCELENLDGQELITKLQLRIVELELITQEQQEKIEMLEMQLLDSR